MVSIYCKNPVSRILTIAVGFLFAVGKPEGQCKVHTSGKIPSSPQDFLTGTVKINVGLKALGEEALTITTERVPVSGEGEEAQRS